MTMFRAEKTTRNENDFKVLTVGIICTILILMIPVFTSRFEEMRWYRDITRITPFHGVELHYSNLSEDGNEISFGGELIKRRCKWESLSGYVYDQKGLRHRVPVNFPKGKSRPPSDLPESWGAWSMNVKRLNLSRVALGLRPIVPVEFEVFANHIECPTEPLSQENRFVKAKWMSYKKPQPFIEKTEIGDH